MWLFYFYGTCLFALGWCSIIGGPPQIQQPKVPSDRISFHGHDEGIYDVFLYTQLEDLKGDIIMQLQQYHVYLLDKMKNLEAACKPAKEISQRVIEYQVSEGGFKDPVMNHLVKIMTNKMAEIASITMDDDLEPTLHNFSILMSKRMQEKFAPLTDNVNGLRSKMAGLATKSALIQLKTDVSNLVLSNIGALKEYLNTLASKPELNTKTYRFNELFDNLQQKVEALKGCEDSAVLEDILKRATKSMENLAEVKENFLTVSSGTSCSKTPVELLLTLKDEVHENAAAVYLLSFTTGDLERNFSSRLEELTEILKQSYEELTSHSTAKLISTLPTILSTTEPPTSHSTPPQCLDSNFFIRNGKIPDVCDFTVRLRKCHLKFLAFHCCRSCMNAGLITTMPNFSASRDVPVLQALTALQPKQG